MNAGKAVFDTSGLLYMYSSADAGKTIACLGTLPRVGGYGRVVVSTQVVQEFFIAALRKLALPRQLVREIITVLLDASLLWSPRGRLWMWKRGTGFRFGMLIIAAAKLAGAEVLFTEDLNNGQCYGSVVAQNPFRQR